MSQIVLVRRSLQVLTHDNVPDCSDVMLNLDGFLGDVCVHEHDLKDISQSSMINYIYIVLNVTLV